MLRALTCTLALAFLMSGLCLAGGQKAQDKDKNTGQEQKATITKLDAKNHSITLKMRDKSGKETERNFKLTEDIQYVDSTGKVATVDVFRSGDDILVTEREGKLTRLKQDKNKRNNNPVNK